MEQSVAKEVFEMKTPEEIKKGLECCKNGECEDCRYLDGSDSWSCVGRLIKDVFTYIQQLEAQQPRWISVGERLPEDDGCVLCYLKEGSPNTVCIYYADGELFFMPGLNNVTDSVTHWMPLPQPPKEERK